MVDPAHRTDARAGVTSLLAAGVGCVTDLVKIAGAPPGEADSARETAIWLLGRLREVAAVGTLVRVLVEPNEEEGIRALAAVALGDIAAKDAVDSLVRAASVSANPLVVRQAAVHAAALCSERVPAGVVALIEDASVPPALRGSAIEAVAACGEAEFEGRLRELLSDVSPEVRFWAAYALGEVGTLASVPALGDVAARDRATVEPWGAVRDEAEDAIRRITGAAGLGGGTG